MSDAAGERRIVSVLVTDVVDSTTIAERLGPERSKFFFDEIARLMDEQVRRFGGTVAQHTGDGVLALFGAPVAHGDDAERAVRAALGIHEALGRYALDVADAYAIELGARAAINTGPVVVPASDASPDVLYNALGDTVNIAARLQAEAGAGGVAVGPATAHELVGRFELEPLGELELKGKSDLVAAFRVSGEVSGEVTPRPVRETPLIGREDELATVVDALTGLEDGLGAIVLIAGEPGIGKSRLVSEAQRRSGTAVRFLTGNAVSYSEQFPFWPVRDLLRGWLGLGITEPEGRLRLELKASLAEALGDRADEAYPFVATLLGLTLHGADEERLRGLGRDSVQRQTFEAVATLLEALAREQPLCLVLEDLQWADESTLELLEELLSLAEREALALFLLYRSDREHRSWHLGERARQLYPHRLREVELRPLAPGDSKTLADGAAGAELPERVAELLASRSGGNPFFLEEALQDLVERGALRRTNAHWELAVEEKELTVPLLVQEALQTRLDRLDPATREVASVAAVVGRSFGLPLLERLTERDHLLPALSKLQRLDLIVEERRRPAAEYRFRHGLVQEVAYAALVESRRRELHRAAGLALEELHINAPEEISGLLAYHFAEADEPETASRYLVAAGDAARALYANQEALERYRRAVPFLDRIGDERGARDTLLRIGLTHHLAFEFEAANSAYQEAFARRVEPEPASEPTERLETTMAAMTAVVAGHANNNQEWWTTRHLFRGLLRVDEGLNVLPDVATSFHASADGLRYLFHLRPDARWSDGTRVTAHDFVYTWTAIRESGVSTAFQLEDIAYAEATDDRTLTVELVAPRSYFLYLAASVPLFPWPRHAAERRPDWYLTPGFPCNGPYLLAEIDAEHLLLRASPTWERERGNVDEVHATFGSWLETETKWSEGELDFAWGGKRSPDRPDTLRVSARNLGTWYVGFGCERAPLDDVRVRRALAHAIDRERFVSSTSTDNEPAVRGGWIPPALPAHSHRVGLEYDPERARALLAEAGFPDGYGLPELMLICRKEAGTGDALDLVDQWSAVGVRVAVELIPISQMNRAIVDRADLWIWGWQADYPDPDGMLRTFMEGSPYVGRADELAPLLERGRSVTNPDERWRIYREADRLLVADHAVIVPLAYTNFVQLHRPWVDGVSVSPLQESTVDQYVVRRDQRP